MTSIPLRRSDCTLGSEEREIIEPSLQSLRASGIDVIGPAPADTAFTAASLAGFDAVLAMYHDQGLTPIKSAGFGRIVNVTLGLPIIRTSVDHGTAFAIAGAGRADDSPLRAVVRTTLELISGDLPRSRVASGLAG